MVKPIGSKNFKLNKTTIILVLIAGLILLFGSYLVDDWSGLQRYQNCISSKEKYYSGPEFQTGMLYIVFYNNVTYEHINDLIEEFGVKPISIMLSGPSNLDTYARINVPTSTQVEWVCKFENNNLVRSVDILRNSVIRGP